MNKLKNFLKHSGLVAALLIAPYSLTSELTVPNQFSSGDVTSASDVNANFAAIEAAVNDNVSRIAALEGQSQGSGARAVFQGFSAGTVDGAAGLIAMQQQCDTLVEGSHICTDGEIAKSPYNSQALNLEGKAWVIRELGSVSIASGSDMAETSPLSLTNYSSSRTGHYNNSGSCFGWTSIGESHMAYTVNDTGQISNDSCVNQNKVACCK
jgi:hypothetical protein